VTDARPRPPFAHASEAELARILDFYQVAWVYEPHTFPILFDRQGTVLESFTPDFFLPELDLYVEITTLRQSLVRKKNRKLRRLRELYPGIRVKLLYARDFRALLLKYGRIALAAGLSGSEGQATPPRRPVVTADAAAVVAAEPRDRNAVAAAARGGRPRRARRSRAEARARAAGAAMMPAAGPEPAA
jgi:hypoxanthine phosphoribosyltransferase